MSGMRKEIITTKAIVKFLLKEDKRYRESDMRLFLRVAELSAFKKGYEISKMSFSDVITNYKALGVPSYETVRRTRQKIQEEFPELRADIDIETYRAENEMIFREEMRK